MNYQDTLDYLYSRLPMFTRIGKAAFKKDLTNTLALCDVLGQPQHQFKSIHIAGTNGKGSTSHMLAAVLQNKGYKTGLYTSPHLKDFRERIRINGQMIPEQYVVDFVAQYQTDFERIEPSFFEWTVALCFDYFAKEKVDIAIIETGLGGRFDSTNVISPLLSVITNIGWDHMDMLGDTLDKIAFEKAGIIKPNTPVVIGEYDETTRPVFESKAKEEQAKIRFAADEYALRQIEYTHKGLITDAYHHDEILYTSLASDLGGQYQQYNIPTVLCAIDELNRLGFAIDEQATRQGISNTGKLTGLMGRWQTLQEKPRVICDTGHNVNGITLVIDQLNKQAYKKLHMVIGMVKDKDISKVLSLLPVNAEYYFCNAAIPRALPAAELAHVASEFHLHGTAFDSVQNALNAAKQAASDDDLIFVGGSTFVVAEAL